jgi:hypothetical protein
MFATLFGAAALATGLTVAGAAWIEPFQIAALAEPNWFAALFLLVATLSGGVMIYAGVSEGTGRGYGLLVGATAFAGMFYVGVVIDGMVRLSEEAGPAIAELKGKLPPHTRLVSFGMVETLFTYYYQDPVALAKWPTAADELDPKTDYFCFTWDRETLPTLPFEWRVEGEISCDRQHQERAVKRVIVGKRIDTALVATARRKIDPTVRPASLDSPVASTGQERSQPTLASPKRIFDSSLQPASFESLPTEGSETPTAPARPVKRTHFAPQED